MDQLFRVTVNGVTKPVKNAYITEEIDRFYNVATFDINEEIPLESTVVIYTGSSTFTGTVNSSIKIDKEVYRIECRTQGMRLTEPYSPNEETYDEATTSHDLVDLYASKSNTSISITSANLSFLGSYKRSGTMLSSLMKIANVTGAEYWDDGSSIRIEPNKPISGSGIEVPPSDIFDFLEVGNNIYNKGVGVITIRNGGSETNDIISENNIYIEIDQCTGELFVFPNPYGEIEKAVGTSTLTPSSIERQEIHSVLDVDLIRLDGAISSITEVTLNGSVITDYNFSSGHNVIYFTTPKRGTVTITYIAKYYSGYANISNTEMGRFITFDMYYLDQIAMFQGFLSQDCNDNSSSDGEMTIIMPDETYYPKGFDFYTIGGDPEITFYDHAQKISESATSTSSDYISVESASFEPDGSGGYRSRTRYPLGTALGAKSSGVSISYTTSNDGEYDYFNFTQYYPNVEVSYKTPATKHHVEFPNVEGGDIWMVVRNRNTDEAFDFPLDGIDRDDLSSIPCELFQNIPVNISDALGIDVTAINGVTVTWTAPDLVQYNGTINEFGIVDIYVDQDGDYVIDTSGIKNRTTVTLTVNVNG